MWDVSSINNKIIIMSNKHNKHVKTLRYLNDVLYLLQRTQH